MLPVGIHLSYWQVNWQDDLQPLIGKAKSAGFDVAEFPILEPRKLNLKNLRRTLDHEGMLASCGTGLDTKRDISSPDLSIRQAGVSHLRACIESAAILGSPVLGGVIYTAWGDIPPKDRKLRRAYAIENLQIAAMIAEEYGVYLCLEVLNRFEGWLINTVEEGLELLAEVNSPFVKLHLDTFHLNIEEDDIASSIRHAGENLGHFHCVENNRKVPGRGHIPWGQVRDALREIGYSGYLVTEAFVNPSGEVGNALFIWRSLADDPDLEARSAAEFLKREVANV
ncbi:sugar phosphate isomerase [Bellilinea caldifistulae]|uniref:sugar phosphate isomerase/epimerase family protein n=1 Tax=Bellilinea caldifistulae TaxID=360411 RepID=UPI000784C4FF|nr:sugar phosphate isomerase/epimerase family protein [Bellilinea caldifistulae]GAP09672.1 sugar phosphate isomerase [Bellilinea caldifistulae]